MRYTPVILVCFLASVCAWTNIGPAPSPVPASAAQIQTLVNLRSNMETRWRALDEVCSTNAPFALTYLIMTEFVTSAVNQSYFARNDWMVGFTVAFASRYLAAIDGWNQGLPGVSNPWLEAFHFGAFNRSSVLQDILLGINAHVNYDLAVVNWQTGWAASRSTYKKDYDRINDILAAAGPEINVRMAAHYDAFFEPNFLTNAAGPLTIDVLSLWRENAWVNGESLYFSFGSFARNLNLARIDASTVLLAKGFEIPSLTSTAPDRIEYCQTHPAL